MRTIDWRGVAALGILLAAGVGGGLGSLALGYEEVAASWMAAVAGFAGGLLLPQVALRAPDGRE